MLWYTIQSADRDWMDRNPSEFDRMVRKLKGIWKRFPHLNPIKLK